jgi:hypothetical protein
MPRVSWCFKMITTSCHSIVCSNANAFTAVHFVFIFQVCRMLTTCINWPNRTETFVIPNRVCTKEESAIIVALKTVYFLAQEGIALSKYTNMMQFFKKMGNTKLDSLNVSKRADYSSRMLTTCINWPNGTETFLAPCFRWLRVIRHHRPQ